MHSSLGLNLSTSTSILCLLLCVLLRASKIKDCCCDTETVSANNQEFLNEILTVIRKRTFFRIFKVDIYKSCKLWPDNALCFQPTCSIRECCEEDIPQKWRDMEINSKRYNKPIDLFVSEDFNHWDNVDEDQWVSYPTNQEQMIYVDLERNPDGYTGYKGAEAGKIWKAIYEAKNLLYLNINISDYDKFATEDRVLYRLISGFHTLTTCMVFAHWPLPNNPQQHGPNLELYTKVLHGHTDWIDNLYFDFVFLLRAINKASEILREYDYHTGNPSDDAMTMGLINYLLQTDFIQTQCSHLNSFDESQMFQQQKDKDIDIIMHNFRNVFRNISDIIDCVGCEKCKLHAKAELLGLGTALKILFTKEVLAVDMFERNEMLALIVTLGKYSDAIQFIEEMEQQIEINKLKANIQGCVLEIKSDENDFEGLISKTFKQVFESNSFESCREWKVFCVDAYAQEKKMDEQQVVSQIANNVCNRYREYC